MNDQRDQDGLFAEANAWFFRLKADNVTDDEKAAFAAWKGRSEAHGRAWTEVLGLMTALEGPARRSHAAFAREARAVRPRRRAPAVISALLAAGVAAVAVVQGPVFLARLGADFVTEIGERRVVTLDDGTRVDMNSDTALALEFTGNERRVEVRRGEAFFTVAPGEKPFVVEAGPAEIRDIGTAFSVEYGARARVTVEEGLVDVGTGGASPVRVAARQRVDFDRGRILGVTEADPETALAWRNGQVMFRQERLADVVAELNRYRAGHIIILNPNIADFLVSGVFSTDRPETVTAALESVLGIEAREITPLLVLLH